MFPELNKSSIISHLRQTYGPDQCDKVNFLPYHNALHAIATAERTRRILSTWQAVDPSLINDTDIEIGCCAALCHDYILNTAIDIVSDNQMRKRKKLSGNEEASAEVFKNLMAEFGLSEEIYQSSLNAAIEGILATIVIWDADSKSVNQVNLKPESSLIAKAIAWADVGAAGMEGYVSVREDTINLLMEDYPEIDLTDNNSFFRELLRNQIISQQRFVTGRQQTMEVQIQWLPENLQEPTRNIFNQFSGSLAYLNQLLAMFDSLNIAEVLAYNP